MDYMNSQLFISCTIFVDYCRKVSELKFVIGVANRPITYKYSIID